MHYLTRLVEFEASHRYWNPAFSAAENQRVFGTCVSPYGHGHNYVLRGTLAGQLDPGSRMDISKPALDHILNELTGNFDHKVINHDHPAFHSRIPTTEKLAPYMREQLAVRLRNEPKSYQLFRLTLYEESSLWADVFASEGQTMASLTKTFTFSAAHRLHSAELSDEQNRATFGKCNNLNGHGHNYELEVTVRGHIDSRTGMIMDLGFLMQVVQEEVLDRFDHKHLNQ